MIIQVVEKCLNRNSDRNKSYLVDVLLELGKIRKLGLTRIPALCYTFGVKFARAKIDASFQISSRAIISVEENGLILDRGLNDRGGGPHVVIADA